MRNNIGQVEKRRVLKKVRRNFINKTPEEPEATIHAQAMVASVPAYINPNSVNLIDAYYGIVEKNRKIYHGIHYVQSEFNIANITVDRIPFNGAVTISIQQKEFNNISARDIGIQRLESYGDLSLATLGWKVKNRYASYPNFMQKYFEFAQSKDPIMLANFRKVKNQAALVAKEIESKYAYIKDGHFFDRHSPKKLSVSYSQKLIEDVGYNIDEFVNLVQRDGLPNIFKGDSPLSIDKMKYALENSGFELKKTFERPEFEIQITNKQNVKKKVIAQCVGVLEPVPEGLFFSIYFLIKRECNEEGNTPQAIRDGDLKMKKIEADENHRLETGSDENTGEFNKAE